MKGHHVPPQVVNVLSVDIEEYFHPSELAGSIRREQWAALPSRIERQTMTVLDILARHNVSATFFILGWVAEHHPRLVETIAEAGHEIGCHSYWHSLIYDLTPAQFREDTQRAVQAIHDACGIAPQSYRAPSYSITEQSFWALEILGELGFTHDSSIYPIRHDRYGIPGFARDSQNVRISSGRIVEVPIATAKLPDGRLVPVGGGGYMRLLPYCYTAAGLRRINLTEGTPACIYFHPWELDHDQPRLCSRALSRWRTYSGLRTMKAKIERLLTEFEFAPLIKIFPTAPDAAQLVETHVGTEAKAMQHSA